MHNYVVNGDFSNGLDDNWYNSNETNNAVMDVSGLGTVAENTENILKRFVYTAEI